MLLPLGGAVYCGFAGNGMRPSTIGAESQFCQLCSTRFFIFGFKADSNRHPFRRLGSRNREPQASRLPEADFWGCSRAMTISAHPKWMAFPTISFFLESLQSRKGGCLYRNNPNNAAIPQRLTSPQKGSSIPAFTTLIDGVNDAHGQAQATRIPFSDPGRER